MSDIPRYVCTCGRTGLFGEVHACALQDDHWTTYLVPGGRPYFLTEHLGDGKKPNETTGERAKSTKISSKFIICDATNNPPTTCEKTLNVRLCMRFEDQYDANYIVDMPIPLRELRDGTLRTIEIKYVTT
jgi:hypothetical protein